MKIIQLTLHIDVEEVQTIIAFIDELKSVLIANYAEEIRDEQQAYNIITDKNKDKWEGNDF